MNMQNPYVEKQFVDRFTKPTDAVKYISELESLDLSKITEVQLGVLLDKYFPIFPYTSGHIQKGEEVFRARININNKPFTNVKEIYVRDKEFITSYGRAHRPKEQIFYCSSNYLLAAFEVIHDLKNSLYPNRVVAYLTVGIWKAERNLHISNIIHSKKLHALRKDMFQAYHSNQDLLNTGRLKGETIDASNLLLQFFSDQFTKSIIKSDNDYKISAFYASRLMQANELIARPYHLERFDGINYPSVAMKYQGDNQAIFTNDFENKFKLVNAIQVVCENVNFDTGDFLPVVLQEAESIKEGIITWKTKMHHAKSEKIQPII